MPTNFCDIPLEEFSCKVAIDIEQCFNAGYTDEIGISVDIVAPEYLVAYEHPKNANPDLFNWKMEYELNYKNILGIYIGTMPKEWSGVKCHLIILIIEYIKLIIKIFLMKVWNKRY